MDAIRKAVSTVNFSIPKALLQRTFIDTYRQIGLQSLSVDAQIESLVIRARVLQDCNLLGGVRATIPLEGLAYDVIDKLTVVMRIPKNMTQGRSIMSVQSVNYVDMASMAGYAGFGTGAFNGAQAARENTELNVLMTSLMAANDKIPVTFTSDVKLIAENTIMIKDGYRLAESGFLTCTLTNDENLANISPRSIPNFAQLVVLAVKSYIYNSLIIDVDVGQLQAGFQIGMFKTVLDGYSDSEEAYQDYLNNVWAKVAFMNDSTAYGNFIRATMGGIR
jgi:hypothetical protein